MFVQVGDCDGKKQFCKYGSNGSNFQDWKNSGFLLVFFFPVVGNSVLDFYIAVLFKEKLLWNYLGEMGKGKISAQNGWKHSKLFKCQGSSQ